MATTGEEVRIERRTGGYALCGAPECIDARRFERLIARGDQLAAEGTATSMESGAGLLREALGLWRGPALADFAGSEFALAEAVRLDELRLEITGRVVDLELGVGVNARLVSELESLVAEYPLQERFWGQLMTALYRDGRQADALKAYHRARQALNARLGVQPGPALRRLQGLVLNHSPELDSAVSQAPIAARTKPGRAHDDYKVGLFVGRERELAVLEDALARATQGTGQLVVIEAAAGLGKTALLDQFASRAGVIGVQECRGGARENSGAPPYWPWVEVLRIRARQLDDCLDPLAVSVTDLVPDWDRNAPRDPTQARIRLY